MILKFNVRHSKKDIEKLILYLYNYIYANNFSTENIIFTYPKMN